MKKVIQWFSLLPEPLKSQAFENAMSQQQIDIFNVEVSCMYNAIDRSMIWDNTPQRSDYWLKVTEQWDEDTNTLRIPLTFSSSMRTMLLSMRHDCKVANALLRDSQTHTTFANYITMRGEMCSYLPNGREHTLNENGKWARNGRQDMKVGKMAKNLLTELAIINNDIQATDLEKFSNLVKSYISVIGDEDGEGKKITLEVVNGRKIYDAYLEANYSKILGTDTNLFNSCMRYDSCQDYLDIYVDNVEVVSMLVANDSNFALIIDSTFSVDICSSTGTSSVCATAASGSSIISTMIPLASTTTETPSRSPLKACVPSGAGIVSVSVTTKSGCPTSNMSNSTIVPSIKVACSNFCEALANDCFISAINSITFLKFLFMFIGKCISTS